MDSVNILVLCFVKGVNTLGLGNRGKQTEQGGEFPAINPFSILTDLEKMFIVLKFPTAHNTMEFLGHPMSLGVRLISGVARGNGR